MSIFDDLIPLPAPDVLPASAAERALLLRNGLISQATNGSMQDGTYKALRKEFMADPDTCELLPAFVRTCHDPGDFWSYIKVEFSTYAERRTFIREAFTALLAFLERRGTPAAELISDVLISYDEDGVHRAWQKALKRSGDDPEGAITSARTLLESVCKNILDDSGGTIAYAPGDDLPKLYRAVAETLNIAPSQHTEEVFRRILGGCTSVVEGLGALRNKVGDAHGQGKRPVRVAPRHAHLAVNLAGTMAVYLIETRTALESGSKRFRPHNRHLLTA